jgi:3-polyprenyl-4-hydroxybenzoate decarboxylase
MSTTSKIVLGVGIASGALLAAWLLTGTRKEKTKMLISKGTERIKQTIKTEPKARVVFDDSEVNYV